MTENDSIDRYELMTGYQVDERNSKLLVWPINSFEFFEPCILQAQYIRFKEQYKGPSGTVPYFYLVGKVDGISCQVYSILSFLFLF